MQLSDDSPLQQTLGRVFFFGRNARPPLVQGESILPKKENTGVVDEELDSDELDESSEDNDGAAGQSDEGKERKVPLKVLNAVRRENQDLKTKLARLEGKVDGISALQRDTPAPVTKKEAPREYTRVQLDAAVTAGTITEATRDEILQQQSDARQQTKLNEVEDRIKREARAEAKIDAQLQTYVENYPDLTVPDSELRARVQEHFDELVRDFGEDPKSAATQLKAVKMSIPSISSKAGRKKQPEAHEETGGADNDADSPSKGKAWSKGLSKRMVEYYDSKVSKGIYKGYAAKDFLADVAASRQRARQ